MSQYYLEKNLDARARELEREAELDEKAPKVKAKSKMSKVRIILLATPLHKWYDIRKGILRKKIPFLPWLTGWEGSHEETEKAGISGCKSKIQRAEECKEMELSDVLCNFIWASSSIVN